MANSNGDSNFCRYFDSDSLCNQKCEKNYFSNKENNVNKYRNRSWQAFLGYNVLPFNKDRSCNSQYILQVECGIESTRKIIFCNSVFTTIVSILLYQDTSRCYLFARAMSLIWCNNLNWRVLLHRYFVE